MALDKERLSLVRIRWNEAHTIFQANAVGYIEFEDPANPLAGIEPLKPYPIPLTNEQYAKLLPGDILILVKENINGLCELPEGVCVIKHKYQKAET